MEDFNALYCVGWIENLKGATERSSSGSQYLYMCLNLEMNFNLWSFTESAYWQQVLHIVVDVDIQFWSHVTPW